MTTRYWREGVRVAFVCPQCSSREWGSSRQPDGSWVRSCHGVGCRLRFAEADDYLYFTVGGARMPTRLAYERATTTSSPSAVVAASTPSAAAAERSPSKGGQVIPLRPRTRRT